MTRELERRYLTAPVEWRAASDGKGPGVLFGYAAKYNTLSQNLGGFVETIAPGAFDKSIADNVRTMCRYNHKDAALLGTTDAATLRLSLDDIGLLYEVDLPNTTAGNDVAVLAARGDVRFSSFAFYCIEDKWGLSDSDFPLRTLRALQLVDVAPVNTPAYMDTSVAKRSLANTLDVDVEALADKQPEDVRGMLTGEVPAVEEIREDDEPEAPATVPASIQRLQMELNEQK